jgi:hypothetical protein
MTTKIQIKEEILKILDENLKEKKLIVETIAKKISDLIIDKIDIEAEVRLRIEAHYEYERQRKIFRKRIGEELRNGTRKALPNT